MIDKKDETTELSFLKECPSLQSTSQIRYAPIGGIIRRVTISWPRGCNFLVEVLFQHKRNQFLPYPTAGTTRGIALDNFTETLNPLWPIPRGDPIEMVLINHDEDNPHTISAIVHIDKKEEY